MIGVNMKGLIDKLNGFCVQVLNTAAGMAVSREHYEVTFEHFLLALLEEKQSDLSLMTGSTGTNIGAIQREVARTLSQFRTCNTGKPVFSPTLQDILEAAWLVSSVDLGSPSVRSAGVLLAFLKRPGFYAQGDYTSLFRSLDADALKKDFASLTRDSCENSAEEETGTAVAAQGPDGASGQGFIERFCEDFTAKARAGKVDPVFGRDQEIRQMVAILARRRKNNPILVGEPGVGKTAVMEGLALRISEGDVPQILRDTTLLNLDMGLLEAGASVKGEFERRLKGVLDEIKSSPKSIILFIDEAHLLVGGGASAGSSDAANLMKPALARGEIRTCAATTWKEYKKYFEKDAALARRFQLVSLDEPSVATTALILRGLRAGYEAAHGVLVRDEALDTAAEYSDRYISGRFLPDKAVDLLDTACARVKISMVAKPASLEDAQRKVQACMRQIVALKRDMEEGVAVDEDHLASLKSELQENESAARQAENAWRREKELAQKILDARAVLANLRQEKALAKEQDNTEQPETGQPDQDTLKQAEDTLKNARSELAKIQGDNPLVSVEVTSDAIAQVVSDWTGIPVGKMARDQAGRINDLFSILSARIRGQDMALHSIAEGIQASKAGLRAPNQPLGVFLLVGPSGVGKTETGLALADALFGDERSVITINMSEFQEKHTVSRLIGSPPGYVGYGEGGLLTEAVRRKPYSVVLLDEVEKAHTDVMQLFYQVFDKGVLTDGEGTEVNFRNTVIMLTSNLGSEITQALCDAPEDMPDTATVLQALRPLLSEHFQPALLARMSIVPYVSLTPEALRNIAVLKLNTLASRLAANSGMKCTFSDSVPVWLASRCTETETGARNIDYVLAGSVLPRLAREILSHMASDCPPGSVSMDIRKEEICLSFDEKDDARDGKEEAGTEEQQ